MVQQPKDTATPAPQVVVEPPGMNVDSRYSTEVALLLGVAPSALLVAAVAVVVLLRRQRY
jgi:hypothetical protein